MGFSSTGILEGLGSFFSGAGASAGAGSVAGAAAGAGGGITAGEVSAGAAVLGAGTAAYSALSAKKPVIPPSPVNAVSTDQSVEDAQANAMRRQSIAGGLSSTVGTSGGQAGTILNPANMGGKSLLGQ